MNPVPPWPSEALRQCYWGYKRRGCPEHGELALLLPPGPNCSPTCWCLIWSPAPSAALPSRLLLRPWEGRWLWKRHTQNPSEKRQRRSTQSLLGQSWPPRHLGLADSRQAGPWESFLVKREAPVVLPEAVDQWPPCLPAPLGQRRLDMHPTTANKVGEIPKRGRITDVKRSKIVTSVHKKECIG